MKIFIILSVIIFASVISFNSCQKELSRNESSLHQNTLIEEEKLDISIEEFQQILLEVNSLEKVGPAWWERFKDWVNSHSGNSQQYVNGQPACFGDGGCGPCAGACFGSAAPNDNDGAITTEQFALGLRAVAFSIIEKNDDGIQRKMLIQIPNQYKHDFIMDKILRVGNDEELPAFYVSEAGFNSIKVKAGLYPVIESPQNGISMTIVNISVE